MVNLHPDAFYRPYERYVQLRHPERMANVAPTPVARPIITDSVVKVRGGGTKVTNGIRLDRFNDMPLPTLKGMVGIESKAVGMPGFGVQPRDTRVRI